MWIVRLALRRPYTFVVLAVLIAVATESAGPTFVKRGETLATVEGTSSQ